VIFSKFLRYFPITLETTQVIYGYKVPSEYMMIFNHFWADFFKFLGGIFWFLRRMLQFFLHHDLCHVKLVKDRVSWKIQDTLLARLSPPGVPYFGKSHGLGLYPTLYKGQPWGASKVKGPCWGPGANPLFGERSLTLDPYSTPKAFSLPHHTMCFKCYSTTLSFFFSLSSEVLLGTHWELDEHVGNKLRTWQTCWEHIGNTLKTWWTHWEHIENLMNMLGTKTIQIEMVSNWDETQFTTKIGGKN
jgi:hypothetical protein